MTAALGIAMLVVPTVGLIGWLSVTEYRAARRRGLPRTPSALWEATGPFVIALVLSGWALLAVLLIGVDPS